MARICVVVKGLCDEDSEERRGGWGAVIIKDGEDKETNGYEANTSVKAMELQAAIMGLSSLKKGSFITICTDSVYVNNGIKRRTEKDEALAIMWNRFFNEVKKHKSVKLATNHEKMGRAKELAEIAIKDKNTAFRHGIGFIRQKVRRY